MDSRIVVVGSLNADFVLHTPRFPAPGETVTGTSFTLFAGGKGANQAYGAARLAGRVSMVGQVGADDHGAWLKKNLAEAGCDVTHVGRDPATSSGVAVITVDASGQNHIVIIPGANGTFGAARLEPSRELIESAEIVMLQLEIPAETVERAAGWAKRAGATVILDPAPAAAPLTRELMKNVDYLTPNEPELAQLCGERPDVERSRESAIKQARLLLSGGAAKVLVKRGDAGAMLISHEAEHSWPAFVVEAVDSTAAGDVFNAAFAVALGEGRPDAEAGLFAVAASACSVRRRGAQASMPSRREVEDLLKSR